MRGTEQKSYVPSAKTFQNEWVVIDVKDRILGRVCTKIAQILMGKHKPTYTRFLDTGDHVIVLNAEKVLLSGKKATKKTYSTFSGYPGGNRFVPYMDWMAKFPERIIEHAVLDMLPRGTLGRQMVNKLHVYKGDKHPHAAQKPKTLEIK